MPGGMLDMLPTGLMAVGCGLCEGETAGGPEREVHI